MCDGGDQCASMTRENEDDVGVGEDGEEDGEMMGKCAEFAPS